LNQTIGSEPLPSSTIASTIRSRLFRARRSITWTKRPPTVAIVSGWVNDAIRCGSDRSS
jgi:hypothetical protein